MLQEQLFAAQNNLTLIEGKFKVLSEQLNKLQSTTSVLESELHKKDVVIENYDKEISLLKAANEQLHSKLMTS